jgi:hypothetical protein
MNQVQYVARCLDRRIHEFAKTTAGQGRPAVAGKNACSTIAMAALILIPDL